MCRDDLSWLPAHCFIQAELSCGLPGSRLYVHYACRALDWMAAALCPWVQPATGVGWQGTNSPWIRADPDPTTLPGCANRAPSSVLLEWLPGPLPGWPWPGFGLHLLSSATLLPFFVGQLLWVPPDAALAEEAQQNKKRGPVLPGCVHSIFSPSLCSLAAFLIYAVLQINTCSGSSFAELVIPDNANVFYAMNSHVNFDFILRKKASVTMDLKMRSHCNLTLPRTAKRGCWSNRLSKITLWGRQGHRENRLRLFPLLSSSINRITANEFVSIQLRKQKTCSQQGVFSPLQPYTNRQMWIYGTVGTRICCFVLHISLGRWEPQLKGRTGLQRLS